MSDGDLLLFWVGHGALCQGRLHFRLRDRSQVLRLGELALLLVSLLVMVPMTTVLGVLLMTLLEMMMTFFRIALDNMGFLTTLIMNMDFPKWGFLGLAM